MKITKPIKHLLLTVFLFVLCSSAVAQKKHFIYIQAEDKQPFYITVNSKNYSSTVNGHLVIPKLKNGKYFFVAGFPKDKYPEQKFTCIVEDKDQGFVLKQFGADGWGLFNLVSFTKIMSNPTDWEKDKAINDTVKIEDGYAFNHDKIGTDVSIPSKAATVTTKEDIGQIPPIKSETPQNTEVQSKSVTEKSELGSTAGMISSQIKDSNSNKIIRTYQKGGSEGIDEVYIDYTTNPTDTIAIFIPVSSVEVATPVTTATEIRKDSVENKSPGKASQYNTSCVHLAEESEFAKTRKLMSAETTDDKMIQSAKKSFSLNCYTTEQIKNLGLLFLSEQSRLKFFSMAKPHVYDRFNYASLETQFTLSSAIDQFRKSL